ncbi:hypothetical protein ACI784_09440 [Geodermatophilus sp. SYSU D01186]
MTYSYPFIAHVLDVASQVLTGREFTIVANLLGVLGFALSVRAMGARPCPVRVDRGHTSAEKVSVKAHTVAKVCGLLLTPVLAFVAGCADTANAA